MARQREYIWHSYTVKYYLKKREQNNYHSLALQLHLTTKGNQQIWILFVLLQKKNSWHNTYIASKKGTRSRQWCAEALITFLRIFYIKIPTKLNRKREKPDKVEPYLVKRKKWDENFAHLTESCRKVRWCLRKSHQQRKLLHEKFIAELFWFSKKLLILHPLLLLLLRNHLLMWACSLSCYVNYGSASATAKAA